MIRHLSHKEIDKNKWDHCIEMCNNKLPYVFSWWLDIVSPGWEALIEEDYETVMPLTWKKKYGISYLFQPYFTQQLGIFSNHITDSSEINAFLDAIPIKYKYIDIHFNKSIIVKHKDFKLTRYVDHVLNLYPSYEQIQNGYHRNCRRNIRKSVNAGLIIKPIINVKIFSEFIERNLRSVLKNKHPDYASLLKKVADESLKRGNGNIMGVFDHRGEMNAAAWIHTDLGYCLFLVCASTTEGSNNQAMYFLVDHIIREKAGSEISLDFTGSNIPGVSYFNSGFGAVKTTYQSVKRNSLPWPVKLFKK